MLALGDREGDMLGDELGSESSETPMDSCLAQEGHRLEIRSASRWVTAMARCRDKRSGEVSSVLPRNLCSVSSTATQTGKCSGSR